MLAIKDRKGGMMKDLRQEGYLEAIMELGVAQDEQTVFEQDLEKFKSFLFAKGKVYGGRWWVGNITYQRAMDNKFGKFSFAPGRNGNELERK